jgi:hypothetical protein
MKTLLIFGLLLLPCIVSSQQTRASVSKNEALIGERILLSFSVPIVKGQKIEFISEKQFMHIFRMNDSGKVSNAPAETMEILKPFRDTVIDSKGNLTWTGLYEVTIWDSGTFVIQDKKIRLGEESLRFPKISLTGKLSPKVDGMESYDIEEYFSSLPKESVSDMAWRLLKSYGWIILVLLAGILIWWIRKSKRTSFSKTSPTRRELCLMDIDALSLKKMWEKDAAKEHYVQLSLILRSYLSDCYSVNLTERTTDETLLLLKKKTISPTTFDQISSFLQEADLVKFAKFIPQDKDVLRHLELGRTLVLSLEPTPQADVV